jgi:hypothetical protein
VRVGSGRYLHTPSTAPGSVMHVAIIDEAFDTPAAASYSVVP